MTKCFLLENDLSFMDSLKAMLAEHCPSAEVVGTAASIKEALANIPNQQFDVAFFDIELDDGLSFDLLNQLPKVDFDIIFVTGFDKYAIKAFRYSAIDYLLKPVDYVELIEAFSKIKPGNNRSIENRLSVFKSNTKNDNFNKLAIPTLENIIYINVDDIINCEASGNYTTFHRVGDKPVIASKIIKDYTAILPEDRFVRVHKSHLVNIKHIVSTSVDEAKMVNNNIVPIARRRKQMLAEKMQALGLA